MSNDEQCNRNIIHEKNSKAQFEIFYESLLLSVTNIPFNDV